MIFNKKKKNYLIAFVMFFNIIRFLFPGNVAFALEPDGADTTAPVITLNGEQNTTDTTPPAITLNGDLSVSVANGAEYTDAGVTITDDKDTGLSATVTYTKDGSPVASINTNAAGTYVVHYNVSDAAGNAAQEVTRTVVVQEAVPDAIPDTTAPVITLNGNKNVTVAYGAQYTDAGVTITDDKDTGLSAIVTYTKDGSAAASINTSAAGTYVVHYNVSDAAGNAAIEVTRTVVVQEQPDTVKPVITLVGEEIVNVPAGSSYIDAGVSITDNKDTGLAEMVTYTKDGVLVNSIYTFFVGTYIVHYNVSDAAGNAAVEVTRTVNIVSGEDSLIADKYSLDGYNSDLSFNLLSNEAVNNLVADEYKTGTGTNPGDGGSTNPGDGGTTNPGDGGTANPGDGGNTNPGGNTSGGEKSSSGENNNSMISNTSSDSVVNAIKTSPNASNVQVDVSSNKNVSKDIFDAMKNTDKTVTFKQDGLEWSFKGTDITEATKAIDMKVDINTLEQSTSSNKAAIANKVNNEQVMIVSFANNGQLPGRAGIRLKLSSNWLTNKDKNNIAVYYYNETTNKIENVTTELKADGEGYIQFFITHNSDYIITDKKLSVAQTIERLGGSNRYETSVKVSQNKWTNSDYAVLASGEDFADALCAAPLAKQLNAPILLASSKALEPSVIEEFKRLKVKKVYIIGGTGAVGSEVENVVKSLNISVERISGNDRYETSAAVAQKINKASEVFLCTGKDFADALSISSYAAANGNPILLASKDEINGVVLKFIKDNKSKVYVIGGNGVISDNVVNIIAGAERISGADRYDTNSAVISKFKNNFDFSNVYVSIGQNFPDAICGSALAGANMAPIILINTNNSDADNSYIKSQLLKSNKVNILGGEGVISTDTINRILKLE